MGLLVQIRTGPLSNARSSLHAHAWRSDRATHVCSQKSHHLCFVSMAIFKENKAVLASSLSVLARLCFTQFLAATQSLRRQRWCPPDHQDCSQFGRASPGLGSVHSSPDSSDGIICGRPDLGSSIVIRGGLPGESAELLLHPFYLTAQTEQKKKLKSKPPPSLNQFDEARTGRSLLVGYGRR
ncbi:hypothetical protein VTK26DRAFT_8927 [Humicola hyalothermophila]